MLLKVLGYREVGHEHQLLVYDADPVLLRIKRAGEALLLSGNADLTAVGLVDAAEYLDQRGLARAVFAQQGVYLACTNAEVDVVQHLVFGKALGDVLHVQKWLQTLRLPSL